MNELTLEERLMLWEALFAGYFNTPFTPEVLETVYGMKGDEIRKVLATYSTEMKGKTDEYIVNLEATLVAQTDLAAKYRDMKDSIDEKAIPVGP